MAHRVKRTNSDLENAAGHVGYEWAMLLGSRQSDWHKLPAHSDSFKDLANKHARTEVVLLHARLLHDFLFRPPDHSDDVSAVDFLENGAAQEWESDRENLKHKFCPYIQTEFSRLNKRLFHLSYDRAQLDESWKLDTVINELADAFRYFCEKLTAARYKLFHRGISTRSSDTFPFTERA